MERFGAYQLLAALDGHYALVLVLSIAAPLQSRVAAQPLIMAYAINWHELRQ